MSQAEALVATLHEMRWDVVNVMSFADEYARTLGDAFRQGWSRSGGLLAADIKLEDDEPNDDALDRALLSMVASGCSLTV
eukprot:CAMPEP_0203824432 /NCGR_PEP_ID=MMETSP0115-20131106/51784_1 /ASSEMBLY_ACC=CAM_ASM_000227 /TAXON_ID=33651 /ORGANISM="Bicosoecid sp, Strain ms1" /LENGTH=79 /DNA_ID=CAMNT_0050733473 /DNA_START=1 /DNA_END=236 /DNA_ORIENTATION=+